MVVDSEGDFKANRQGEEERANKANSWLFSLSRQVAMAPPFASCLPFLRVPKQTSQIPPIELNV